MVSYIRRRAAQEAERLEIILRHIEEETQASDWFDASLLAKSGRWRLDEETGRRGFPRWQKVLYGLMACAQRGKAK